MENLRATNLPTLIIGAGVLAFLYFVRLKLKSVLVGLGTKPRLADVATKAGPVLAVAVTILAVTAFNVSEAGVPLVGAIPRAAAPRAANHRHRHDHGPCCPGAPHQLDRIRRIRLGRPDAAKRRQRILPDQELIGLGAANIASGISAGYPVTGGFARSVVNFDAGAETPAAGIFTAIGIALATLFLTPLLANLPQATLAATIIVAVLSLVDLSAVRRV